MKNFEYAQPSTEAEALALLAVNPENTELLAGGTDLVGLMKSMVVAPDRVVNVSDIESMQHIETDGAKNLWIGASVHLDQFLDDALTDSYPAVKQAIQGISSIQLQSQGTIGGEILRRPTCWYFRDGHGLLANRGQMVVDGDNRFHAILGNRGPAKFVNASRLAPALISLGAKVRIVGPQESDEQVVALETLYQAPSSDSQRENVLQRGQLVTHLILPPTNGHLSATYEVSHGVGPDQPLTAAAATLELVGGVCRQAKIVLGQVAPTPWISAEAERSLLGKPVNYETAEVAGVEALSQAMALSNNAYKIQMAQVAVKRAILLAAGIDTGGF